MGDESTPVVTGNCSTQTSTCSLISKPTRDELPGRRPSIGSPTTTGPVEPADPGRVMWAGAGTARPAHRPPAQLPDRLAATAGGPLALADHPAPQIATRRRNALWGSPTASPSHCLRRAGCRRPGVNEVLPAAEILPRTVAGAEAALHCAVATTARCAVLGPARCPHSPNSARRCRPLPPPVRCRVCPARGSGITCCRQGRPPGRLGRTAAQSRGRTQDEKEEPDARIIAG